MADFTLVITLKDVAEGDATTLAQDIWDANAESFDATRGAFGVSVLRDGRFDIDWEPVE